MTKTRYYQTFTKLRKTTALVMAAKIILLEILLLRATLTYVCMYVCIRKFITLEFLQPKQSRVCARRPY